MPDFREEVIPTQGNETIVELSDQHVDSFGRRQFTAHWLGFGPRAVGFGYGHRGQVFNTRLGEFIRRHVARGESVRVVGPFPKPAPQQRKKKP
jgi:hypothetical protein